MVLAATTMQKKPISIRLPDETLEDMAFIAQYLLDQGNDAAMYGGKPNSTYAVIYAIRQVADQIRKQKQPDESKS